MPMQRQITPRIGEQFTVTPRTLIFCFLGVFNLHWQVLRPLPVHLSFLFFLGQWSNLHALGLTTLELAHPPGLVAVEFHGNASADKLTAGWCPGTIVCDVLQHGTNPVALATVTLFRPHGERL